MSAAAGDAPAALRVALDIRHPLAYLALGATLRFASERGIGIDWLPLEARPLRAPSTPAPDDDRGIRHKRSRAWMVAREIAVYSRAQGLTVLEPYRDGSPRAAHLAWLWVRSRTPEQLSSFLVELFRRYWALELDPDDIGDVEELLRAAGLLQPGFEAWVAGEGMHELAAITRSLSELGIDQVPAFLVEDELFYGRQHLPMIGWILDGRTGTKPI